MIAASGTSSRLATFLDLQQLRRSYDGFVPIRIPGRKSLTYLPRPYQKEESDDEVQDSPGGRRATPRGVVIYDGTRDEGDREKPQRNHTHFIGHDGVEWPAPPSPPPTRPYHLNHYIPDSKRSRRKHKSSTDSTHATCKVVWSAKAPHESDKEEGISPAGYLVGRDGIIWPAPPSEHPSLDSSFSTVSTATTYAQSTNTSFSSLLDGDSEQEASDARFSKATNDVRRVKCGSEETWDLRDYNSRKSHSGGSLVPLEGRAEARLRKDRQFIRQEMIKVLARRVIAATGDSLWKKIENSNRLTECKLCGGSWLRTV
ncbi:hypothetical protein C8Q74DRAFT_575902 [Fomes fomentarius]|nr:hypothetical protein C8Q74DRAFT_575902 [Fomes fomentarius]